MVMHIIPDFLGSTRPFPPQFCRSLLSSHAQERLSTILQSAVSSREAPEFQYDGFSTKGFSLRVWVESSEDIRTAPLQLLNSLLLRGTTQDAQTSSWSIFTISKKYRVQCQREMLY
ncbi:MAG: hypothetical protein DMG96_24880 [Acidobacteria bacterium]|nr:MAG: hypothetical protein DMG96_24880 [Acidobacteriota bacterium]